MRKKALLIASVLVVILLAGLIFAACDGTTKTFTVTLETGSETATTMTDQSVLATAPDAPTRDGYRFEGWYLDPEFTQEPTYPLILTADVTLYARWTQLFTVTFEENGGSELESITTDVIGTSPRTYRDGFVFAGWYTSPRLTGAQVKFPYTPTANVTLYAKWTEDSGSAEYSETSKNESPASVVSQIKEYFAAMNGTAFEFDSLLTTTAGTARVQLQANLAEGQSTEFMFRVTMQEDERVAIGLYVVNGEMYLDFGNGEAYVHLTDFKPEYLLAILEKAGAEIDLEELLGNLGGINVYNMLLNLIFSNPLHTVTTRVATGEIVRESFLGEVKVNSLITGIKELLDLFNVGSLLESLIGINLDLNSLFNWLDAAIPQIKMYIQVDCEYDTITDITVSVADNASGSEGDELLDWSSTKIGYYDFPVYIDMPTDLAGNSREFSFTNLAFDVDLTLAAPENGLDVAKLIGLFTDDVPIPEDTLVIQGQFGFRLSARVELDLNYEGSSSDDNLIALDLYVLGADGNPTSETPTLGIYYRDGAFYISLSDLIPDYWNAKNIKIEANLDALIGDLVNLITKAIDEALGTDFDEAKSLSLSYGNVYEATLVADGDEIRTVISPTISGLLAAVVGVIGLQENVYVDEAGDSIVIDVNQKFFDVINGFLGEDQKIVLPAGLSNMGLSINFADYGLADVVAMVNLGDEADPLEAELRAHNFKVGFLEGSMQDLESYIAERTQGDDYTSNLGDLIYSVLAGAEINAHGTLSIEAAEYALGKLLAKFGLDTGKDNPVLGLSANNAGGDRYEAGIELLAAFSIDKENPAASKLALELKKTGEDEPLLAVYGYYEDGISTVLLDLSGIKTQFVTLPIYKFEFDFANIVIELIDNISINGNALVDTSLAFDLGGLIGGSAEAEALIMAESDGTAGGTELTQAGAVLIGLSADKITASVTFAALITLLENLNVDTGISPDALDLAADLMLSTHGVTLDLDGKLPKVTTYDGENALPTEYGDFTLALETGTSAYPISIGNTTNLDAAIARGKAKAATAEDSLYDVVFDFANSMQASMTINIANEKDTIDIASMINNILAKEGSYIGFPINLVLDKNEADLYLDLKWDIHLDSPFDTKIYLELRYGQKKIISLGIQEDDLYVDLEGLGLFEFRVVNSELATSLFTMLDEQFGVLRDTDLGALLTGLVTGTGTMSESGDVVGEVADGETSGGEQSNDTMAILSAILGDVSIYDGVIRADIAAATFNTIFDMLLGTSLGVDISVEGGEIDLDSGTIKLPVSVNETFNMTAELKLSPAEEFSVTSGSDKVLDATDGEAMARSLLKRLNMDFNLDILNNSVESGGNSYLRVRIKNVVKGEGNFALDGTSDSVAAETLVISLYMISSEDRFNNTTQNYADDALLHITLDYSDDALGADGTGKNMKIVLVPGKFTVQVLFTIDLASIVGSMLEFQMDIVGMLSGAMQSIIDSLVFTEDGVEVEVPEISAAEDETTGEEGGLTIETDIFDNLDINELLSGGIDISLRSTGTLNINVGLDPYTFNKLIDDLMGNLVFGAESQIDLSKLAPDMFGAHYLKYVNWDRLNYNAFWSTLSNELKQIVKTLIENNVDGIGGLVAGALDGAIGDLLNGIVYDIVKAILPLPVYNEVNAGVNLVDGTLTNIYIEGYDYNQAVTNEDGEVLEYHGKYCVNNESNIVSTDLVYDANQRSNNYKTEINLYDCFSSVGDPDNTVDGSNTAGVVNWGNMEFDMSFEPLAYENDVVTSDYEFIQNYFYDKIAVYQQGTTVMKANVKFYMWNEETGSYGGEITLGTTSLGLLNYANNDNLETVTLKGKAEVSFPNGVTRSREFTITVYPNLAPALIDTVRLHAYDDAPSSIIVYFRNMSSRRVELSAIKELDMPTPMIEGGTYEATVTFRNGAEITMNIEYHDSTITTLGSDGESGVYELDLYTFDSALDIMSQLPTQLFFSYSDGKYGAIDVENWAVDAEVLEAFATRQPSDLGDFEFTATATVGEGNLAQDLDITVRIRGKEVTSLTIDGEEDKVVINPYDYYLYTLTAAEGSTYSPWPTNVDANYLFNGEAWSESVKVIFSTDFDFSTLGYNAPGVYTATATLDKEAYGNYFGWSREVSIDVQSNVIEGIYFDRALRRNTISVDALSFNAMTAEEKQALFPTTAWVKFENGYTEVLPIRWTDRNGYALDFASLTFDAANYDVVMYAEIGYSDDAAIESAFYQRCAMTVKVTGALEYLGSGVTVDPYGEGGAAQFPTTVNVGNSTTVVGEIAVDSWFTAGVDFSAKGGEYIALANFTYNGRVYTVVVPVTVTARELVGFEGIDEAYTAVYDEMAGTFKVTVGGTEYDLSANKTATATLTAKFSDNTTLQREVTLDFGQVTEAEGAYKATISITDTANVAHSVEITVNVTVDKVVYKGSVIAVDPLGETGAAQFPSTIKVGNSASGEQDVEVSWNTDDVVFSSLGGEYAATASFTLNGKDYSIEIPVKVNAAQVVGFEELADEYYVAVYDETTGEITIVLDGESYDVADGEATVTLTATLADGGSSTTDVLFGFGNVIVTDETVFFDAAPGTTPAEQGATEFAVTATVYDGAGNTQTVSLTVYVQKTAAVDAPVEG